MIRNFRDNICEGDKFFALFNLEKRDIISEDLRSSLRHFEDEFLIKFKTLNRGFTN